jgi:hypothetical protein
MKTLEAIAVLDALNIIATRAESLPMKFAYAAAKNRRKLAEFADVYQAKRNELLEQFGKKDEQGVLVVKDGNVEIIDPAAFTAAFNELTSVEAEVSLHTLAISDFPQNMDLAVMDALMPMVKED